MTKMEGQQQKVMIELLVRGAKRDRETAEQMLEHRHFDWSLFVYHLALEKMLKVLIVQTEQTPPFTHNLGQLADAAELDVADEWRDWLGTITDFNLEARYPAEKEAFYHKADSEFTEVWHSRCNKIFIWLTQEFRTRQRP